MKTGLMECGAMVVGLRLLRGSKMETRVIPIASVRPHLSQSMNKDNMVTISFSAFKWTTNKIIHTCGCALGTAELSSRSHSPFSPPKYTRTHFK